MERDRSSPNLTQEQQQQLEQQKEQQKTQHQEQHLPQVMGQVNNELDKNPGAKQALAPLAPQQQSELKQQVAQAAFRGAGKNAPQIDYIGISKKDGSLVMQANKYFISNFDIPKSSLPQQPQPAHRHGLDGPGTYTIQPGDSLSRIGQRLSPNDQRLARAASELALYNLQDNGKLRQVGGETNRYIIQPGDKVTVDLSKYDQAGIDRLAHNYARRETNEHKQDVRIQQVQEQRAAARAAELTTSKEEQTRAQQLPSAFQHQLASGLKEHLSAYGDTKQQQIVAGFEYELSRAEIAVTEGSTVTNIKTMPGGGILVQYNNAKKEEGLLMLGANYAASYVERDTLAQLKDNPQMQTLLANYGEVEKDIILAPLVEDIGKHTDTLVSIQSIARNDQGKITLTVHNDNNQVLTATTNPQQSVDSTYAKIIEQLEQGSRGILGNDHDKPLAIDPAFQQKVAEQNRAMQETQQVIDGFSELEAQHQAFREKLQSMTTQEVVAYLSSEEAGQALDPTMLSHLRDGYALIQYMDATKLPDFNMFNFSLAIGETIATGGYDWVVKLSGNVAAIPSVFMDMPYEEIREDFVKSYSAGHTQNYRDYMTPINAEIDKFAQQVYQSSVDYYGEEQARAMAKGLEAFTDLLGVSALYSSPLGQAAQRGVLRHQERTTLNADLKSVINEGLRNPARIASVADEMFNIPRLYGKEYNNFVKTLRDAPKVVADVKVDGIRFFDSNQGARPHNLADSHKRTLIADIIEQKTVQRPDKALPNGNMATAHAEIGLIQNLHERGLTKGKDIIMRVDGQKICGYCLGDIAKMAERAEIKSLMIMEEFTGQVFNWKPGMRSLKEVGK